jgi:hypothetical protein
LSPVRLQESGGFNRKDISTIQDLVEEHQDKLLRSGMNSSVIELKAVPATSVQTDDVKLTLDFSDGRTIFVPLAWYPRLVHAIEIERNQWRLIGKGRGIHWDDLDEDIGVEHLIFGKPSSESQTSFEKWLNQRKT